MSEGSESLDSFELTRRPSPLVAGGCLSPLGRNILGSAQYALHGSYRHSYPGPGCVQTPHEQHGSQLYAWPRIVVPGAASYSNVGSQARSTGAHD